MSGTATRPAGYPATPNLDKMVAVHETSEQQGAFLEWLVDQGFEMRRWEDAHTEYGWETRPPPRPHYVRRPPDGRIVGALMDDGVVSGGGVELWPGTKNATVGRAVPGMVYWWEQRDRWRCKRYVPGHHRDVRVTHAQIERWLAEYHGIDYDEMNRERERLYRAVAAWANRQGLGGGS